MKKLFFALSLPLFLVACDAENRHKEPGQVRNDTLYDTQYMINEEKRDSIHGASGYACIDSSKIDPKAICTEVYEPVCGCDRKTYSNSCKAISAGVADFEHGECK